MIFIYLSWLFIAFVIYLVFRKFNKNIRLDDVERYIVFFMLVIAFCLAIIIGE